VSDDPSGGVFSASEPPTDGRGPRRPRNYLARGERSRLFWLVMPVAAAVFLGLGIAERTWFARSGGGDRQVDTRLEAVTGPGPSGDEIVMERDAEPLVVEPAADLGASLASLSRVRDATFFRESDNDAWFQIWNTLRETGLDALRRAHPRDVGFRELFGQPRSFRGRLVRMRGTFHRLERLTAPANDYSIDTYWQGWLEPADGPASPVVVQCLALPEGMPTGMDIAEPVEIVGYFFKNYAYNAADTIRVAPVIMAQEPIWRPLPKPEPGVLSGSQGVTIVLFATLAAVLAATVFGAVVARRPRPGRAPSAAGLDAALADVEPFSVDESLRRLAAATESRRVEQGTQEPQS
jgi:hypothetical protein